MQEKRKSSEEHDMLPRSRFESETSLQHSHVLKHTPLRTPSQLITVSLKIQVIISLFYYYLLLFITFIIIIYYYFSFRYLMNIVLEF